MSKTQTLKILCPHCEELVKVTYAMNAKGKIEMHFTHFTKES